MTLGPTSSFGIRDNHGCGKAPEFLVDKISDGSILSVVSAYFTIYAYVSDAIDALAGFLDLVGGK